MKCPTCKKGRLADVEDILHELENYVFIIKGRRCTVCGEEIIEETEGQKMINAAKKMGVWGTPLRLHRKLSKSARGTVLRIPIDIEKSMHLEGNEHITISKIGNNKLLIEIED